MTLTLMQDHSGSPVKAQQQNSALNYYLDNLSKQMSIKLATTVGHLLRDLDFEFIWLNHLGLSYQSVDTIVHRRPGFNRCESP